jgi:hypothetical protein
VKEEKQNYIPTRNEASTSTASRSNEWLHKYSILSHIDIGDSVLCANLRNTFFQILQSLLHSKWIQVSHTIQLLALDLSSISNSPLDFDALFKAGLLPMLESILMNRLKLFSFSISEVVSNISEDDSSSNHSTKTSIECIKISNSREEIQAIREVEYASWCLLKYILYNISSQMDSVANDDNELLLSTLREHQSSMFRMIREHTCQLIDIQQRASSVSKDILSILSIPWITSKQIKHQLFYDCKASKENGVLDFILNESITNPLFLASYKEEYINEGPSSTIHGLSATDSTHPYLLFSLEKCFLQPTHFTLKVDNLHNLTILGTKWDLQASNDCINWKTLIAFRNDRQLRDITFDVWTLKSSTTVSQNRHENSLLATFHPHKYQYFRFVLLEVDSSSTEIYWPKVEFFGVLYYDIKIEDTRFSITRESWDLHDQQYWKQSSESFGRMSSDGILASFAEIDSKNWGTVVGTCEYNEGEHYIEFIIAESQGTNGWRCQVGVVPIEFVNAGNYPTSYISSQNGGWF